MEPIQTTAAQEQFGRRFEFQGKVDEMYGIFAVNLLLTVITLGIYHFWGKTRLREYAWSHTLFEGEQFSYTGTGKELFAGYGKALLILIPLLALYNLDPVYVDDPFLIALFSIVSIVVYGGFVMFGGIAQFSSRRYRLSRTRWRNIRFAISGSALMYGRKTLVYGIAATLTAGLYTPFMRHHLAAYQLNNSWFGSERLTYSGDPWVLFRLFLKIWLAAVAAAVAAPFVVGILIAAIAQVGDVGLMILAAPVAVIAIIAVAAVAAWYAYLGGEMLYIATHTRVGSANPAFTARGESPAAFRAAAAKPDRGMAPAAESQSDHWSAHTTEMGGPGEAGGGIRFRLTFTKMGFAVFAVSNLLLMLGTLGLALPYVALRKIRFACRTLEIKGALDYAAIEQNQQAVPASGEGLAEALDIGDLGL